jgi:hypothetical protein
MQNKNIKDLSLWFMESLEKEPFWSPLVRTDVLRFIYLFDTWHEGEGGNG